MRFAVTMLKIHAFLSVGEKITHCSTIDFVKINGERK
jgi:hypothetical protein